MLLLLATCIGIVCGYALALLTRRRLRKAVSYNLMRKLQLIALRNEMKGYRRKRKRPRLTDFQRALLALLHRFSATTTRFTTFQPATLIGWHRTYIRSLWHLRWRNRPKAGRPPTPDHVKQLVEAICEQNPYYGTDKVCGIIQRQLGIKLSRTSVAKILSAVRSRRGPSGPDKQSWKTFLKNHRHRMTSMDTKVVFDWRGRCLFILSVIDHRRRRLQHIRATYHPTGAWISQQMREAFPFDTRPEIMLMDNDTCFLPAANDTLPNMGIKVVKTAIMCPQQNGIVERFNRTLTEELLDNIIPLGESHLNRLLSDYQRFYNSARPHCANDGESPEYVPLEETLSASDAVSLKIEAIQWLGDLHRSYRRAA